MDRCKTGGCEKKRDACFEKQKAFEEQHHCVDRCNESFKCSGTCVGDDFHDPVYAQCRAACDKPAAGCECM
jgi:hypothetical protein